MQRIVLYVCYTVHNRDVIIQFEVFLTFEVRDCLKELVRWQERSQIESQ